ncbi:MAG: class I SAM-dependent methyltransferase [Acidimicrobiales bacterium]
MLERWTRSWKAARLRKPWMLYFPTRRLTPLSDNYGWERGEPVDRRYIDDFLRRHAADIRGRVLEVQSARYATLYGADDRLVDVLDIDPSNAEATIFADLQCLSGVDDRAYDCVIVTQVLQYLQDVRAAAREIHRVLAPGGVALVTVPTTARCDPLDLDRWRFMPAGLCDLFAEYFGEDEVVVTARGNVLTGLAFWVGMAAQEVPPRAFAYDDPEFPVLLGLRAVRR